MGDAVHISDVSMWGGPDRNYFTFVVLSVVFGFFGLDHVYLRSFSTAAQKVVVNFCTLGFWYVWDLLQIFTESDLVLKDGLSSPLDWVRGIGRGVFGGGGAGDAAAPKSYIVYTLLAVFTGAFGLDRLYMGAPFQAMVKAMSCLFLVGWVWVMWDSYHAVFATRSILNHGLEAPPVFDMLFPTPISPDAFKVAPITSGGAPVGWMDWIAQTLGFPGVPSFSSFKEVLRNMVEVLAILGSAKAGLPTSIPSAAGIASAAGLPTTMPSVSDIAGAAGLPTALPTVPTVANVVGALPSAPAMLPPQSGGGVATSAPGGPGPILAGALTALVIAGGAKGIYDFVTHQYG